MAEGVTDTYKNAFNFDITIVGYAGEDDLNNAFTRCSGIVSQSEPMEYMHGVDPFVRKNPGRVTFEDVTLERVYNGQDKFYDWRYDIEQGGSTKYDVTVRMYDRAKNEVRNMTLVQAWPIRWELPELDASGSGAAIERITLSIENVLHSPAETTETSGY